GGGMRGAGGGGRGQERQFGRLPLGTGTRPSAQQGDTRKSLMRPKEEQVANFLREGIIAGRFPRGARLKQQEIATLLQTSITPVREALKLLEAEGYVTSDNYRGATVAPFNIEASREVLNLRILLESQLVRGAVEHATAADITEL